MEITTHSAEETKNLAKQLSGKLKAGDVLALYGDLGSGKTTFTSHLVAALGFESRVQSPTFVIVRNYERDSGDVRKVFHIDLYRLTSVAEVDDIGMQEMLEDHEALTIIEWPEVYEEKLPKSVKKIYFKYIDENERKINVQNIS